MEPTEPLEAATNDASEETSSAARPRIRTTGDAARVVRHIALAEQEHFYVLGLDARRRVVISHCAAVGTVDRVNVLPRDVFRELIRHNSAAFIVAHNHPSGDCYPSTNDWHLTFSLQALGDLLGIALVDHLILGGAHFYSIREEARLPLDA